MPPWTFYSNRSLDFALCQCGKVIVSKLCWKYWSHQISCTVLLCLMFSSGEFELSMNLLHIDQILIWFRQSCVPENWLSSWKHLPSPRITKKNMINTDLFYERTKTNILIQKRKLFKNASYKFSFFSLRFSLLTLQVFTFAFLFNWFTTAIPSRISTLCCWWSCILSGIFVSLFFFTDSSIWWSNLALSMLGNGSPSAVNKAFGTTENSKFPRQNSRSISERFREVIRNLEIRDFSSFSCTIFPCTVDLKVLLSSVLKLFKFLFLKGAQMELSPWSLFWINYLCRSAPIASCCSISFDTVSGRTAFEMTL